MNKKNFDAWLEELRTTDKKQGKDVLKSSDDHYCCLGIGCELMGLEPIVRDTVSSSALFAGADILAPPAFFEWLGLDFPEDAGETQADLKPDWGELGDLPVRTHWDRLSKLGAAGLNDDGFTFAQIADIFDYFGVAA